MSKSAPLPPEVEIAVFEKGSNTQGIPACRVSLEEAQYQVDCGTARWVNNRYKSIIMLVAASNFKVRDRSCQMGPRVMEANAMGDTGAAALVEAWRPVAA